MTVPSLPPYPIIDTHVHVWQPARVAVPWLAGVPALNRAFLPADLHAQRGAVELAGLVFVEADVAPGRHIEEARWVQELAASELLIQGIVAHAPLHVGAAVEADLQALKALPLLRGVRRLLQDEDDAAVCLSADFLAGLRLLPSYELHFEITIRHQQMPAILELVARCPEVRFVLDHIGKPAIAAGQIEPWRRHMVELAQAPNVVCKLSGVATEADHAAWTPDDLRPYIAATFEAFGAERTLFGGDWPVATLAIAYPRWVELVWQALAGLDAAQRRRVLVENAVALYRLPGA